MPRQLAALIAVLLLASPALAKKPKPPPCDPGSFLVIESEATLLPEADPSEQENIAIGADGMVSISSGCPAAVGKLKARRKGTKVTAKWSKETCTGLPKKVKLKASFDESCQFLTGKLKSRKHKRTFTAERLFEPESFGAPSLTPTLEPDAALSRSVGEEGGDVLTWGVDETTYELSVPPGSLAGATRITLTPVVSLDGLPLEGGLLQAVNLEPSGLAFATPATLTITPSEPLAAGPVAGFGWSGDDDAFAIAPWWVEDDRSAVHVAVSHFSGYGLGIPGPSQLDAVAGEVLAVVTAEAAFHTSAVACDDLATVDEASACMDQLFADWYDQLVKPKLDAGGEDPVAAIAAHIALRNWRTTVGLFLSYEFDVTGAITLISDGVPLDLANLAAVFAKHMAPDCGGTVTDWRDWLRIPEDLRRNAEDYPSPAFDPGGFPLGDYCVTLRMTDVSFPETLGDQDTEFPLSLQTVIREHDGNEIPVATNLVFSYGPGTSGPDEAESGTDGSFDTVIDRQLPEPRVLAEVVATHPVRPEQLRDWSWFRLGPLDFFFLANAEAGPRPIVPTGGSEEVCVLFQASLGLDQPVAFSLDGPGSLSAPSVMPELLPPDGAQACLDYVAPDGPVARNLGAAITATLEQGGTTYTDVLVVQPHWVDIRLRADVGSGWVSATNTTVTIPGDGPYTIEAVVEEAGETTAAPPVPLAGAVVFAGESTGPSTLSEPGTPCCSALISPITDEEGRASFQWRANGTADSEYPIEVRYDGAETAVAASVTLERAIWFLNAAFPSQVEPGVDEVLTITVTDGDGSPVPGAWVEIDATGGSVADASGTTDASGLLETTARLDEGQTTLTLTIRLYAAPGGQILDSQTVEADAPGGGGGMVVLEEFEFLNTTCVDANLETAADGTVTITGSVTNPDGSCIQTRLRAKFFVVGGSLSYELETEIGAAHIDNRVSLWPSFITFTGVAPPLECFPDNQATNCPDTSSGSGVLTPGPYTAYVQAFEGTSSFTLTLTP